MNHRWSLSCVSYLPGSTVFWSFIAVVVLSVCSVRAAGQQADCSLRIASVAKIFSYQGSCSKGFIRGKADVLYLRKNSDGSTQRVRHFGYFLDGEVHGAQVVISTGSDGEPITLLAYYPTPGRLVYALHGWPDHFDKGTIWEPMAGEQFRTAPRSLTNATGNPLQGAVSSQVLFSALGRDAAKNSVLSLDATELENFFSTVSIKNPFANTNATLFSVHVRPDPDPVTGLNAVQTMDGCQFLVSAKAAKDGVVNDEEDFENRVWDGVCLNGWAYGPGTTKGTYSTVEYEWVQAGAPIGMFKRISNPIAGLTLTGQGYKHPLLPNVYFSKTRVTSGQVQKDSITVFAKGVADGTRLVTAQNSYFPVKCTQKDRICIVEVRYPPNHYYFGAEEGFLKLSACKQPVCDDEWIAYIGPRLDEMNTFIAENKPKVDQIIQANTSLLATGTTLKQRTEAAALARTTAQQRNAERAQRIAQEQEAKARQLAERQRALSEAKSARRPMASPNLDALIARAQAIKIPAPTRQQPATLPRRVGTAKK